ncbi:PAS domain-containing protein [Geodermatophilus sp. YIM 151500]|uniref:CheR family methyltransferase n=1 Tax=Geodermatophilus sp. YIM 151500 TaxID=2984531 RepID=UPI0021E39B7B|nr:CheR family methyltransferase [Geodermatophilus sp. YIM 151500]MCV2491549.1 PAS domain-containing protein [Geodermatophilus sp. YIM 151500]
MSTGEYTDDSALTAVDPDFEELLAWLKESRGFDFTGYKRPSLLRRITRRMHDVGLDSFTGYRDHLELHQEEFVALFNTILINVTSFFRDPDTWAYLADHVLPELVTRGRPIRAWSAGCASGQEAYSLAMLLAEQLGHEEYRRRVKIYATDVDEEALTAARLATYTEAELKGISPERLERFFEREGTRAAFRKDLRRGVIFGRNDLVQDAPISHVDLLLCRNTLMYFNADTQHQVAERLHFALEPHGVLVLGKAELLLSHSALFAPVDLSRRLFRRRQDFGGNGRRGRVFLAARTANHEVRRPDERLREQALLAAPSAQVVLDAAGVLALSNIEADRLFGLNPRDIGRLFQDLELSYRPLELRTHIEQAATERRVQWIRGVEVHRLGADPVVLDVQVTPLADDTGELIGTSVVFEDVSRYRSLQRELEYANEQLETAYEELQSTNEELETTNEELQSTVEELETTNEELQSTNEELETMNEELQSMNDALHSGNDDLREHTSQVAERNDLLTAVLSSVRAGLVVLDGGYRVLTWNTAAAELWGVREDEALGRLLADLDIGLPVDRVSPVLHELTGSGAHQEVTVPAVNRRGKRIRLRVTASPLRDPAGRQTGTVLLMDPQAD